MKGFEAPEYKFVAIDCNLHYTKYFFS